MVTQGKGHSSQKLPKTEQGATSDESAKSGLITHTRAVQKAAELLNREYQKGWEGVREGRPVAWLMYGPPHEILHCFDIIDIICYIDVYHTGEKFFMRERQGVSLPSIGAVTNKPARCPC